MRYYTLDEARAALEHVRPLLQDLADAHAEITRLQRIASVMRRGAAADGNLVADAWDATPDNESPLHVARETIGRVMDELAARDIEVKDPARGLIDFLHLREGQVVYLCYLLGEPDIEYWHTLEGGFAGRQPL